MSTYWGYVCRAHTPHLESEHWLNWGDEILREVANTVRSTGWPIDPVLGTPLPFYHDGTNWTAPIDWLLQHPHCDVALRSEYGKTEELVLGQEPPGRCIQGPPDTITIPLADLPKLEPHTAHGRGSGYYAGKDGAIYYSRDPEATLGSAYTLLALAIRAKADGIGESTEPET